MPSGDPGPPLPPPHPLPVLLKPALGSLSLCKRKAKTQSPMDRQVIQKRCYREKVKEKSEEWGNGEEPWKGPSCQ